MKTIVANLLFLTMSIAAQAQTIFSNSLNSRTEFRQWTVVDNNGDGTTWQYLSSEKNGQRTFYNYNSENPADDWLISPEITPTASGQYLVSFQFEAAGSLPESVRIYYGNQPDPDVLKKNCGKVYTNVTGKHLGYFFVNLTANQPFYVAFQACSDEDMYRINAQYMEVRRCENPVDLSIEKILTPISLDSLKTDESVKLRIRNSGLYTAVGGSYSVTISVNGEPAFTEKISTPINAGSYSDITLKGKVDLSKPHRNYEVTAMVSHYDDFFADNNSLTTSVRHQGPADVPYSMGFEEDDDTTDVKYFEEESHGGYWSVTQGSWYMDVARTGNFALCYNHDNISQPSDWAIIDGLRMEAGYHIVKFWVSSVDYKHGDCLKVCWGDRQEPSAMTNVINVYDPSTAGEYKQKMGIIYLEKPQVVYIGFHAEGLSDRNWICIDDIEVNAVSEDYTDLHICSLVKPTDLQPQLSSKSLLLKVKNHGVKRAAGDLRIYIDDVKYYDETIDVELMADRQIEIFGVLDKVKEGEHQLRIELVQPDDADQSDNILQTTFRMLGTPDCLWTFENGKLPEEFTFRIDDSANLSSEMRQLVGDDFSIIEPDKIPTYNGTHVLAVATDCTDDSTIDRWIVLPQVRVDSSDACFVTNVGALSESINESYRIKVSEGDDAWWNYNTLLSVNNETNVRVNRGVSLADYVGKEIYIAINITSIEGYCLTFDNMSLYGCSPLVAVTNGINDVVNEEIAIKRIGNTLTIVGSDKAEIQIFGQDGRQVLHTSTTTADISALAPGIYCVKAHTPCGSKILKFRK